jgi:hypothetical protein
MAIQIRQDNRIATAVCLRIPELEVLIGTAKENGLEFSLDVYHEEGFRYHITTDSGQQVLRSTDIADVARYLGLDAPLSEAGVTPDNDKPTQYLLDGKTCFGPVLPQPRQRLSFDATAALPCTPDGQVDRKSLSYLVRRQALKVQSGFGILDCDKALFRKQGDANAALALLTETEGFAWHKV